MGIARKNENSAAAAREVPMMIAPSIVEPERDVPGTSASIWKHQIATAVLKLISAIEFTVGFLFIDSIIINSTP